MTDPSRFDVLLRLTLAVLLLAALGCAQGSGSDDEGGDSGGSVDGGDSTTGPGTAFRSLCGGVVDGMVMNPVPSTALEAVAVDVLQPDMVVITRTGGPQAGNSQLVKLHGVSRSGVPNFLLERGIDLIRQFTGGGAFFAGAGAVADAAGNPAPCQVGFDGGGLGTVGQLYSSNGENINEVLLREGAVVPQMDACGSELLQGCYASIEPVEQVSSQTIRDFLWKPASERDGNLVVLVDPSGITVVVNGQALADFGPSNGRGTTARANQPGGAFGANIEVTFRDREGRTVLLSNGERSVIIPNGAQRVEFIL